MGKFKDNFNARNPLKPSGGAGSGITYSSARTSPLGYSPFKQVEEEDEQDLIESANPDAGKKPGIIGQDTGEVTTDADGTKHTTSEYDMQNGPRAGDKIIIPPKWHGNIMSDTNMLQDEDYTLTKTGDNEWTISGGIVQEGPTERERMEKEQGIWQGE